MKNKIIILIARTVTGVTLIFDIVLYWIALYATQKLLVGTKRKA